MRRSQSGGIGYRPSDRMDAGCGVAGRRGFVVSGAILVERSVRYQRNLEPRAGGLGSAGQTHRVRRGTIKKVAELIYHTIKLLSPAFFGEPEFVEGVFLTLGHAKRVSPSLLKPISILMKNLEPHTLKVNAQRARMAGKYDAENAFPLLYWRTGPVVSDPGELLVCKHVTIWGWACVRRASLLPVKTEKRLAVIDAVAVRTGQGVMCFRQMRLDITHPPIARSTARVLKDIPLQIRACEETLVPGTLRLAWSWW